MGNLHNFFELAENMKFGHDIPLALVRREADMVLSTCISNKAVRAFILTNLIEKADKRYTYFLRRKINIDLLINMAAVLAANFVIAGIAQVQFTYFYDSFLI